MLKKVIIIENEKDYQCDTLQEIVKMLIDENYYNFTSEEKKNKMEMLALANTLNQNVKIVDECNCEVEGNFIIKDEITYILSLLITGNVMLLERKDSDIFVKNIDIPETNDNYIIVNKFAKQLLEKYLQKK